MPPDMDSAVHPSQGDHFQISSESDEFLECKALIRFLTKLSSTGDVSAPSSASMVSESQTFSSEPGSEIKGSATPKKWKILDCPGASLKNSKNNCWFHSALHFLTAAPPILANSLNPAPEIPEFQSQFGNAISCITSKKGVAAIKVFFQSVKDFQGIDNRYGQIAVSDFLEFLNNQLPLFKTIQFTLFTKLQCLKCKLIRTRAIYCLNSIFHPARRKVTR